ncbi:MAG: hypothetical protein DMF97_20980 [Acidobacteria bacterium]|nr:MAG: hypothetical protein DMF97_20980 [Acidobacteriota bacterium]
MRSYRYLHYDVFTGHLFGGNQLAVVLDGRGLPHETMQAIAKEMNFSETTFVLPAEHAGTDVRMRIFTPCDELPMAGHPTIGSTFALARAGVIEPGRERFVFGLGIGAVPVTLEWHGDDLKFAWMTQPNPTFDDPLADPGIAAAALSLPAEAVTASGLPVQVVSCGVPFLFVPLATRQAVDEATEQHEGRSWCVPVFDRARRRSRDGVQSDVRPGPRHCRGSRDGRRQRAARMLPGPPRSRRTAARRSDAQPSGREDGPSQSRPHLDRAHRQRDHERACRW